MVLTMGFLGGGSVKDCKWEDFILIVDDLEKAGWISKI